MEVLLYVIAIGLVIGAGVFLVRRTIEPVTVWEYEKGLKYYKGRFKEILEPGQYWIWRHSTHITRVDLRARQVTISGQEVLSSDAISLKVSLVVGYQVTDPVTAVLKIESYGDALYTLVQLALREIVGSKPIDELLEHRANFDAILMDRCEKHVEEFGLKLLSLNIRDIMFPGDLKNVFAQVVKARKEGQAALEKARGETAALRNLANAARLVEKNPSLLQLRAMQTLEQSRGNTVILGIPALEGVIPVKPDDESQ